MWRIKISLQVKNCRSPLAWWSESGCSLKPRRLPDICMERSYMKLAQSLHLGHLKRMEEHWPLLDTQERDSAGIRSVQSLSHVWLFASPMDCSTPGFPVHGIPGIPVHGIQRDNARETRLCIPISGNPSPAPCRACWDTILVIHPR